jgi:hypothetical protein
MPKDQNQGLKTATGLLPGDKLVAIFARKSEGRRLSRFVRKIKY